MTISFHLHYHTTWGQIVCLTGSNPALGEFDESRAVAMRYHANGHWSIELEFPEDEPGFEYRYLIREGGNVRDREWGKNRTFDAVPENRNYILFDHWQNRAPLSSFYSSAFTECIFRRTPSGNTPRMYDRALTIRVFAPDVRPGQTLAITGSLPPLGLWDPASARILDDTNYPEWEITFNAALLTTPLEYKFILLDKNTLEPIAWEPGENRKLETGNFPLNTRIILSGLRFKDSQPKWKGAGTAVPVFSLRSEESFGIGEFTDLKKMADWAAVTGQRVIQILPVNDTTMTHTWTDSYPYNANSTFALHPLYLNPVSIGELKDKSSMHEFRICQKDLNSLDEIDYEKVELVKWKYFRAIYEETGKNTLASPEFGAFFRKNRHWLVPYAAFCYLRDRYHTADFRQWKMYSRFDRNEIGELCTEGNFHYNEIAIHFFLQFHLDKQLKEAVRYAREKGVILKGDIPIGISRDSVDAWTDPDLFNMDSQAGAPPDDFSFLGQNWGFPTYNWDEMAKNRYAWWIRRFTKMAEYFDAYRIDHILGFFRIWEIPEDAVQGLLGHFNPALPLTPDDMQGFGFWFDERRHARPYIRRYFLGDFFGPYMDDVIALYLNDVDYETYELKPEFDTQRKIERHFCGKTDEKSIRIKNGLYGLADEILFVPDPYRKGKYHPRIASQYTYSYRAMNDYDRWCYDRMYVDFFYHRHNHFWKEEALKKLPHLIDATSMLVCGEDLGMIPASVPEVMHMLQILSLEIQRMPKDPQSEFGNPHFYPYLSVCATSTHDMPPLRAWWEENREKTQRYFNNVLHEPGPAPFYCEPWICDKIIDLNLQAPSMLAIFPLQDWLSIDGKIRRKNPNDERINIPANPRHYWRYRMHLTLEELLGLSEFNRRLREKLEMYDRA